MPPPLVVLHIEAERSLLIAPTGNPIALRVSPHSLATRLFLQGRPSALQLERAIDEVENAIEQAGLQHAGRGVLSAAASLRAELPPQLRGPAVFSRDEIEAEFSQLVAASGARGTAASLAAQGSPAAALLLLRELMHHLGFQAFSSEGPA